MKAFAFLLFLIGGIVAGNAQETFESLCKSAEKEVNDKNFQEALEYYDKAFAVGSENKSQLVWSATVSSMCAKELKDDKRAMKYIDIALDHGSTDIVLIDQQLELANKYKDPETLERVLKIAQNIEGKYEKYTIKLLYFYYNYQKFQKAIETADKILEFRPGHTNSLYFKGIALTKTGEEKEAAALFKEMLKIDPDNPRANLQLGFIHYNRASAIFDKSNKAYKNLAKPTRLDYYNYRQEIRKSFDDYTACLPYLEKSQAKDPKKMVQDAIDLARGRLRQIKVDE